MDEEYLEELADSLSACLESLPSSQQLERRFSALEEKASQMVTREILSQLEKSIRDEIDVVVRDTNGKIGALGEKMDDVQKTILEELRKIRQIPQTSTSKTRSVCMLLLHSRASWVTI